MNDKVITSYKAFDKNMQCRNFQYEVGKEYEMDGEIKCCNRGFHACKSPMEVWDYYDMLNSRYAEVEQSGKIEEEGNSTKVCSSHIKIKAELKLADIIKVGVEWLKDITSPSKFKTDGALNDNGDKNKQIGSSGDSAQIGSSGDYAKIDSTGEDSVTMCDNENFIRIQIRHNTLAYKALRDTLAKYVIGKDDECEWHSTSYRVPKSEFEKEEL